MKLALSETPKIGFLATRPICSIMPHFIYVFIVAKVPVLGFLVFKGLKKLYSENKLYKKTDNCLLITFAKSLDPDQDLYCLTLMALPLALFP